MKPSENKKCWTLLILPALVRCFKRCNHAHINNSSSEKMTAFYYKLTRRYYQTLLISVIQKNKG